MCKDQKRWRLREICQLDHFDKLDKFLDNNNRKSIPEEYFIKEGYLIKQGYNPYLDYLKIVDIIKESEK